MPVTHDRRPRRTSPRPSLGSTSERGATSASSHRSARGSAAGMPRFLASSTSTTPEPLMSTATPPGMVAGMTPDEALRDGEARGRAGDSMATMMSMPPAEDLVSRAADAGSNRSLPAAGSTPVADESAATLDAASSARADVADASSSSEETPVADDAAAGEPASVEGGFTPADAADAGVAGPIEAQPATPAADGGEATPGGETTPGGEGGAPAHREAGAGPESSGAAGGEEAALDLTGLEGLAPGDLDLVDAELAEHQRWGTAAAEVGTAGSAERAVFVLAQIRDGFMQGAAGGAGMGLSIGLLHRGLASQATARVAARVATRIEGILAARVGGRVAARIAGGVMGRTGAASQAAARLAGRLGSRLGPRVAAQTARFTPLPAIGAVIGGVISFHSLYTRDWRQTAETLSHFGEGGSKYETLANSIAAISDIIDIISNVLNVIAGIMGIITLALWAAAVLTAGVLSPLAGTLTAISLAIGVVTLALDAINMIVLQPAVTLFRALHAFTSEADPREVVADGRTLSAAAANNGGALGGLLGAHAANIGSPRPNPESPDSTRRGDDTPPPAGGEGPRVDFEAHPQPPDVVSGTRPVEGEGGAAPSTSAPAAEPVAAPPRPPEAAVETPATPAAATPPATVAPDVAAAAPPRTPSPAAETAPPSRPAAPEVEAPSRPAAREPEQLSLPGIESTPRRRTPAEPTIDPTLAEVLADQAAHQRLASGAPLGEPELGNLPGPPGRHLRRGERDPGNYRVPRDARSGVARESRRAAMGELGEAVAGGTDTPRTAASRETLTPDQLLELTDPEVRRADPERARATERGVEASH